MGYSVPGDDLMQQTRMGGVYFQTNSKSKESIRVVADKKLEGDWKILKKCAVKYVDQSWTMLV